MRDIILQYIEIRNRYVEEFHAINFADSHKAGLLRTANNVVRQFANLTPGPTTPVLAPEETATQLAICDKVDQLLTATKHYHTFSAFAEQLST